jgi:hypothetical protein
MQDWLIAFAFLGIVVSPCVAAWRVQILEDRGETAPAGVKRKK